MNSPSALGTAAVPLIFNGGTLDLATDTTVNAYNTSIGGDVTIISDVLTPGPGITQTLGNVTIGANTLTVTRGTNATGTTAALTFSSTGLFGNATFSPGANTTFMPGPIGGGFGFTMNGVGTLNLATQSYYTGGTTINNGTVTLGNSAALGSSATATVTFGSGGTLHLNGNNVTLVGLNGSSATSVIDDNNATPATLTLNLAGANTFAGILANGAAGTLSLTKTALAL